MKRQVELIQELKTGRLHTDQILKSYPYLRWYEFHLRYMTLLWTAVADFTVGCLEDYYQIG